MGLDYNEVMSKIMDACDKGMCGIFISEGVKLVAINKLRKEGYVVRTNTSTKHENNLVIETRTAIIKW